MQKNKTKGKIGGWPEETGWNLTNVTARTSLVATKWLSDKFGDLKTLAVTRGWSLNRSAGFVMVTKWILSP